MPTEDTTTFPSGPDVTKLLLELEVPFPPDQVRWRVTNTTNDKTVSYTHLPKPGGTTTSGQIRKERTCHSC